MEKGYYLNLVYEFYWNNVILCERDFIYIEVYRYLLWVNEDNYCDNID